MVYFLCMKVSFVTGGKIKIEAEKSTILYDSNGEFSKTDGISATLSPFLKKDSKMTDANVCMKDSPGEYEVKDLFIGGLGFYLESETGKKIATSYVLDDDGSRLLICDCYKSDKKNDDRMKTFSGNLDIMLVSFGGKGYMSAQQAYTLSVNISPTVVIPINKGDDNKPMKNFLKAAGGEYNTQKSFKFKRKDFIDRKMNVFLIE